MYYFSTIEKEGYRFEDLSDSHKNIINWLKYLREDFNSFSANLDTYCEISDDGTTLSQIQMEIADKVIDGVKLWMESQIAEYQITMAEAEAEDKAFDV